MIKLLKYSAVIATIVACSSVNAFQMPDGHFLLEAGPYYSNQGQNQTININGLIGDEYNVTDHHDWNVIVGAGYLWNGFDSNQYGIDFGVNVFYLAPTEVKGNITQEMLFTNLGYKYSVQHIPVYLFAKGYFNTNYNCLSVTVDAGIGPNFMKTNMKNETSLDGITVPDNAFNGESTTTLSGMLGIGLKFYVGQNFPLEIGYRYFYLGEGEFKPRSAEILNKLKTGNNSAQALLLTISL